ncbi:MAG: ABC transporter ATP-binding protein [Dethiobacteria bacterium]|nr:ABC transporter ATP-binding protein [Bacillota bacterium]MDW7728497.1 ABC transporter ATP-binding protein [Bacillota bacterium]
MRLLEVDNLTTYYKLKDGYVRACENISLHLERGEAIGLVGESASGKTTAALSLIKLLPDNAHVMAGSIKIEGRDIAGATEEELRHIRWKDIAIIFQGAMNALNPVRRVGDQIVEALRIHEKLSEKDAGRRTAELFEQVEIDSDRVREYPHEFSGGMRQRVMIAMAIACNPKIIIGDEPTTALDVMVQAQVLQLLETLRREREMGMILITHDLSVVGETCDRVAVMYAGQIVEDGPTEKVFEAPSHPYTRALITAFPNIEGERYLAASIPGDPPNLLSPPGGCRFHERCSEVSELCRNEAPEITDLSPGHRAMCHLLQRKVKVK